MLTFAMGGISAWIPTFLHRSAGLSVANASLVVGAITVVDGIAGTLLGGWLAQRWLRTNDRALYLLSFWSVALTLPFGALLFFGPPASAVPVLVVTEFFLFLNTGPFNAAIVNSVSAPVRATAISFNLFCIHFFGDTFSPTIIGSYLRSLKPAPRAWLYSYFSGHFLLDSSNGCALCPSTRRDGLILGGLGLKLFFFDRILEDRKAAPFLVFADRIN